VSKLRYSFEIWESVNGKICWYNNASSLSDYMQTIEVLYILSWFKWYWDIVSEKHILRLQTILHFLASTVPRLHCIELKVYFLPQIQAWGASFLLFFFHNSCTKGLSHTKPASLWNEVCFSLVKLHFWAVLVCPKNVLGHKTEIFFFLNSINFWHFLELLTKSVDTSH